MWPKDVAIFKGALSFILCSRRVVPLFRVLPGRAGKPCLSFPKREQAPALQSPPALFPLSDLAQGEKGS